MKSLAAIILSSIVCHMSVEIISDTNIEISERKSKFTCILPSGSIFDEVKYSEITDVYAIISGYRCKPIIFYYL